MFPACLLILALIIYFLCIFMEERMDENNRAYDPKDIADYIVWYTYNKFHSQLTSDQIIYILYLIQGTILSRFNKPFFQEDFEIWKSGPVLPAVYNKYRIYGNQYIPIFLENRTPEIIKKIPKEKLEIVNGIINKTYSIPDYLLLTILIKKGFYINNQYYKKEVISKEYIEKAFRSYK